MVPPPGAATLDRAGLVEFHEAIALAGGLRAPRSGRVSAVPGAASRVPLGTLEPPSSAGDDRSSLSAVVGVTGAGPLELDLAAGGPHAIVAGTTGSGKSEFLLAWIAAMALARGPDRVAFLLVDFKGGAAFEPVRELPHVTGIVTDLDESEAERAVISLRAGSGTGSRCSSSSGPATSPTPPRRCCRASSS